MREDGLHKFFLSIVIPSILAIGLYILSFFVIILPSFEKNMMERKKEMISELANTAKSLIEEYGREYADSVTPLSELQELAASRVGKIRYGEELKDYFWIIDNTPNMIMHPYRKDLIGQSLKEYKDPNGKRLFVEAVGIAQESGKGYIDYMWQWKDDSTKIVPKLSYVIEYKPWGWIIGTGIYLEDVNAEIKNIKNNLVKISLIIILIIIITLLFIIRQSLSIEHKRRKASKDLILSRQKYKSLVEASTEGTLMILNQKIIFSNLKFAKLTGYANEEISGLQFDMLFETNWDQVIALFDDPQKSVTLETRLTCKDISIKDVVISVSQIKYADDIGYIIVTKEISRQRQLEKETEHLAQELQSSLLLMNQPIKYFIQSMVKCPKDTTIKDAAILMSRKNKPVLFIQQNNSIIGVITDSDLKSRALAEGIDTNRPVIEIMTSPIISLSEQALLYEAILLFKSKSISHIAIKNSSGKYSGVISSEDISGMQQNSVSYLIKEIESSEHIEEINKIHNRLPALVNALVESGDKTQNITHIITSVSDAIACRIISLAIEELGPPPCKFAFMVMGSEGRMEQTLSTDQDNAIVFEDQNPENIKPAFEYFQQLGQQVSKDLHIVGYRLCKGDVMASNPKWVQPFSVWKEYFTEWVNTSDPQSIMDASIFFDFRGVYGEDILISNLRNHIHDSVEHKSVFFYHLAQSVLKYKPPVGLFGNIVGNNSSGNEINLDIKKVIMPIIGFMRVYALQNQLNETNSLERLNSLFEQKIIKNPMYDELLIAYNFLMQIRFRFQSQAIMHNIEPENIIDTNKLTHIEIGALKKIFGEISNLQTQLNFDFKGFI